MKRYGMFILVLALAGIAEAGEPTVRVEGSCETLKQEGQVWVYELSMSWENPKHPLSHLDVLLDDSGRCSVDDIEGELGFAEGAAVGTGEGGCQAAFQVSIRPGDETQGPDAVVLRLEPVENGLCKPARAGAVTVTFSSLREPAAIQADNLFVVEKYTEEQAKGGLRGYFPALPCNPVGNESMSWSSLKSMYGS